MGRRMVAAVTLALGMGLAVPAAAGAQGNDDTYVGGQQLVRGEQLQPAPAVRGVRAQRAQEGLPVTGGDLMGLTIMGLGAIGAGTILVRRTRRIA